MLAFRVRQSGDKGGHCQGETDMERVICIYKTFCTMLTSIVMWFHTPTVWCRGHRVSSKLVRYGFIAAMIHWLLLNEVSMNDSLF